MPRILHDPAQPQTSHPQRRMITVGFVLEALEPMRERGLDVLPVLHRAGIDPDTLWRAGGQITADQYGILWLGIAEALRDEYFGFGARAMRPGSFTMIGRAVLGSPNLERALRRALRFLTLIIDEPRGELTVADGLATITLHETVSPRSAFAYRAYWIMVHGLACWLAGRRLPLRRVDFRGAEPASGGDYRLFFGAPVTFGRSASRLAFDARYLGLPVNRSEAALKEFLRRAPANILIRYRYDSGINAQVRASLNETPPAAWPDFDGMAEQLRIPASSLRRRLRREGESYAEIRDEIRRERAFAALIDTDRHIGDIAAELGFAEPSAFHRAFRKWTELTPGAYRRQNRPGPDSD